MSAKCLRCLAVQQRPIQLRHDAASFRLPYKASQHRTFHSSIQPYINEGLIQRLIGIVLGGAGTAANSSPRSGGDPRTAAQPLPCSSFAGVPPAAAGAGGHAGHDDVQGTSGHVQIPRCHMRCHRHRQISTRPVSAATHKLGHCCLLVIPERCASGLCRACTIDVNH